MQNRRKRSRLEIVLSILNVIDSGDGLPTHIMYKTNLSWKPLKEFLEFLLKEGLIEKYINEYYNSWNYTITEKGISSLKYFSGSDIWKKLKELEL